MLSSLSTESLARASAAHPWRVILAWAIVFLAAAALFAVLFEDAITTEFNFIGTPESKRADNLLEDRLRGPEAIADVVIVRSDTVTVDDPTFRQTVEDLVGRIRALGPEIVAGVSPFYETGDQSQVSENRRSTFIPVVLTGELSDAETNVEEVHEVLDEATLPAGFEVFITGQATIGQEFTKTSEEDLVKGETFGGAIAIVILTILFGAIAAMVLPIALAVMSIVIALGAVALIGQAFELNLFVQNIITMIGLAVGIDYSLFIVSRFREERTRGVEVREAIVIAGGTASRAVLFSGFMVVLALIGLLIVPHTVLFSLGLGQEGVEAAAVLDRAESIGCDAQAEGALQGVRLERDVAEVRQELPLRLAVRVAHQVATQHGLAGQFQENRVQRFHHLRFNGSSCCSCFDGPARKKPTDGLTMLIDGKWKKRNRVERVDDPRREAFLLFSSYLSVFGCFPSNLWRNKESSAKTTT